MLFVFLSALTLLWIGCETQTATDWFNRGNAEEMKGDWKGAVANYSKAIELDLNYTAAFFERGDAKRRISDWDGAIAAGSRD